MSNKTLKSIAAGSLVLGTALSLAGQSDASQLLSYTVLGNAAQVRTQIVNTLENAPNFFLGHKEGTEGKCGEGKCGEGKCGEGKKGAEGKDGEKGAEGKCGEGKCGEGKCGEEAACGEEGAEKGAEDSHEDGH